MTRQINDAGLKLIETFEGLSLKAYHGSADRPGLYTIGYGHTAAAGPPIVNLGMTITKQEADDILRADLSGCEASVEKDVKVALTDNQFAALVSFVFNVGGGAFENSTLLRKLNAGNYAAVPNELMKWTHANSVYVQGLATRRTAEGKLFASNPPPAAALPKPTETTMSTPASPPVSINLSSITSLFDGNKTYITLAIGAAVVIANHFGIVVPGVTLDPNNWIAELWALVGGGALRSALGKLSPV